MTKRSAQSLASRSFGSLGRWLRPGRACAVAAGAAALLSWTSEASAQGWLADRRYTEGPGIRTGDLELHPGIGGEVGYDSNWFYRSHTEGPNISNGPPALPPADAAIFRITPSFYVSTLGQQRLDAAGNSRLEPRVVSFRGGVAATGRFFIGKDMGRQHNIGLNSDARLDINQGRPIGFGVFAGYNRLIQPQVVADPNLSFNRSDLRGGAEIVGMPGGGTLDLRGGYQINAALFEETNGVPYSNLTHEVFVKNRWRFRPRTAVFHDTSLRFINYPNADRALNYLNDSTPIRTRLGVTGLLTERFGVLLAAGYGATFFKDPAAASSTQYDSINGQAEGTFYLGQGGGTDEPGQATLLLSTVSLGFLRDFQNSLLGNFYNTNRVYGRLEYWFGGKTVIRFDAYGEQLNYPPVFLNAAGVPTQVTGEFSNFRVGGGVFAEYRITSSFGINTTIDYVQQLSDTQIPAGVTAAGAPLVFDLNYRRFQAFAGVRYFF
ncbi:MAG: hypothetical protein KIS78_04045 [Labilithrix sp.]|nr:hypothetical protein [Labilithrix sp.]MCW5831609.1 hypothetical protein [Labilithrix sp.]